MQRDIDRIIERLTADIPGIQIQQLRVTHPGDDDGLWFIRVPGQEQQVQLENSYGTCPLVIESDCTNERLHAHSIEEAVATVKRLYGLS